MCRIVAVWIYAMLATGLLFGQSGSAPVLRSPPHVLYPPIAIAAHVSGEVIVDFSIDSNGRTLSVKTISGPQMLQGAVEDQIKQWQFQTPLPMGSQTSFEAKYRFGISDPDADLNDALDGPSYRPCCGDIILLSPAGSKVVGEVRSLDDSQMIDVTPAATSAEIPCAGEAKLQPPSAKRSDDYVELYRAACTGNCNDYWVRVYRDGHIQWNGKGRAAISGELEAHISSDAATSLLERFQSAQYWSACSAKRPPLDQKTGADDFEYGDFLTVQIDGSLKTVNIFTSFRTEEIGQKLAWAVDQVANTHRWRHGDAATEPYLNMYEELELPKPGVTALMRATYRFNKKDAEYTLAPLKHLLEQGVDVDAADESGWTALMYAEELSREGAAFLLIKAHANVNRASLHGDTPLMVAAYNGEFDFNLVQYGADVQAQNADGVTALMLLAQHIEPETLQEAIKAGADATAQDREGRTALDYLLAASCQKPIIDLPKPFMQIIPKEPPSCPPKTEEYQQSEALLKQAMRVQAYKNH